MSGNTQEQELHVYEDDMETDCLVFDNTEAGVTAIILRPGQSFDNAVKAVKRVCPEMSYSRIQDLVRTNCPSIIEMNERLGVDQNVPRFEAAPDAGVIAPAPAKTTGTHRRPRPPRWARIAAVAAPALVGGVVLANLLHPSSSKGTPMATASPSVSQEDKAAASTYKDPAFKKIAEGGQMKCDPMGAYEAKCVDQDGKVMTSEASVGTSTAFTFSYDYEKVGFRLFPDVDSASAWSAEEANKDLYQNVKQHGRVVLWGTDAKRIKEWEAPFIENERRAAEQSRSQGRPAMYDGTAQPFMASAAPLPNRLAVLAFGTLGVTEESVQRAVHSDDVQSFQLLQAVQLVLGNADVSQLGTVPAGVSDAVAVVLDANDPAPTSNGSVLTPLDPAPTTPETPPVTTQVTPPVVSEPTPPVTAPATATPPPAETKPTETGTAKPPTADTKPPVTEPEQPTPPVVTPPAEPEPDPDPVETAPVDPTPVDPIPADPTPVAPTPPVVEEPVTDPAADDEHQDVQQPETPPAPPVQEEPEDDGLGMNTLPTAWAA
ncbi:hypothetical protein ACFC07_22140 [Streptomyces sp. NPDC056099]|uniref:hypothetical protein n=1 Tax=unclassified Streptomyces TaxID=2593676 RepID=UPI0035E039E1